MAALKPNAKQENRRHIIYFEIHNIEVKYLDRYISKTTRKASAKLLKPSVDRIDHRSDSKWDEPNLSALLLLKLAFLLGRGVLVLLVLRNKIVHVGLGLSELHLVHALASIPVQEGLAAEHSSELL